MYGAALRFAAVLGAAFGTAAGVVMIEPPLWGALFGFVSAVSDSLVVMALIGAMEIFLFVPRTGLGRALAQRPFLVTVFVKMAAYLAVVLLVIGGRFGPWVVSLVASAQMGQRMAEQIDAWFPRGLVIVISGMVVFLLVVLRHATLLVGDRNFRQIVIGRYHRPRAEERFFLFVDVVGSTPVAERLGPLAVHRYLDRVFRIASEPVDEYYGDVYQYVGDEMVATWSLAEGRPEARPLACLFAIEAALAAAAPGFEREFGAVPKIRAALHAGEVVTGEIGGTRRSLVFHGDVMNATSRIENLTRTLGRRFLVSQDALQRLEGAARFAPEDLGLQALRGKEAPMRVYAVRAAA